MPKCHRGWRTIKASYAIFGCAMAVSVLAADQARAQSLFEAFFGIFRGDRYNQHQPSRLLQPPPQRRTRILQPLRSQPQQEEFVRSPRQARKPVVESLPAVSYCVRLCDGRYFPLPRVAAGVASATPDKICTAMCPAADTRIFSGSEIEHAVSEDGKLYSELQSAFRFREKLVSGCTCGSSAGLPGVARIDVRDDPTLERGDIVVTREGPMVFTGNKRPPHQSSAFVPAKDYKGLPQSVRRELEKIEVAEDTDVAPVQEGRAAATVPAQDANRKDQPQDPTPVAARQSTTTR